MNLNEPELRNPHKYYDSDTLSALFEAASTELGRSGLIANIAKNMNPAGFSDPGFLATFEHSFGKVLQNVIGAQRLGNRHAALRLDNDRRGDYVSWDNAVSRSPQIISLCFAVIVESLSSLSDNAIFEIRNISFAHSRPQKGSDDNIGIHEKAHIPVLYDQPHDRIEFRCGFFDVANPNHNNAVVSVSRLQRAKKRWHSRPYSKSCYDYLIYLLDKPGPNLDSAAETFSMAERTLRRKLVGEGMSFREILEQVRRDICQLYFLEGKRQLSGISTLLGYSELSAFTRAYTGWYGHAPSKDTKTYTQLAA